jgi:formylglycine-generating enzyme required for sulfatase activity
VLRKIEIKKNTSICSALKNALGPVGVTRFIDSGRYDNETQHRVTVSGFYMSRYEVTQAEYEVVMGTNPGSFKDSKLPVEMVSWYDAVEYCNARSRKEGLMPAYKIRRSGDSRQKVTATGS